MLEPPTGKKVLEGHRILVTARSLRSVDSSPSRTTDTDSAAAAGAAPAPTHSLSARQQLLGAEQIKCLLLRALLAALPLLDLPAGGLPALLYGWLLVLLRLPLGVAGDCLVVGVSACLLWYTPMHPN